MTHQTLYRKYRPQTFDDVVGQEHITRTLRNAVDEGAAAHAYLFCGPRGTGKTTTARILAKALDCEKGPTGEPDDTCQSCREIAEGRHPDVYELDAASRTGVDAVRDEIITKVSYAATRGPYKIYIIDEVHMLSTSAFNALLKTLEEPPSRTVFVLCTTHPHKVPETIQSRCQRFDFRRISVDDIAERLALIAGKEAISVADGALPLIARHAAGGMRDAIGTLDQLSAFTGKSISLADVEGLLGEVDSTRLAEITDLIVDRDVAGCFRFVARLAEAGTDVPEFVRGLTSHVRDLYVIAASDGAGGIVDATEEELERLTRQAGRFDLDRLARILDELGSLARDLRWAPDPRLVLEVVFTRIARPQADVTVDSLAERVTALEEGVAAKPAAVAAAATPVPAAVAAPTPRPPSAASLREASTPATPAGTPETDAATEAPTAPTEEAASASPVPRVPVALDRAALRRAWPDVLREMKAKRPAASKLFLDTEADLDGDTLVVEFAPNRRVPMEIAGEQETKTLLRESVEHVTGAKLAVRYQLGRGAVHHEADETPAPGGSDPGAVPDAATMLIDTFGAEIVAEKPDGE